MESTKLLKVIISHDFQDNENKLDWFHSIKLVSLSS
jgi:hypothetical protein